MTTSTWKTLRALDGWKLAELANRSLARHLPAQAVFDTGLFDWADVLRTNWRTISDEFGRYRKSIPAFSELDPSEYLDDDGRWHTLFLRWYGVDTRCADVFPETMSLLNSLSVECTEIMFSVLEPGKELTPHQGPYRGLLRYHLALEVPVHAEDCWLEVREPSGSIYHHTWKEGEDLLFDDVFEHWVRNDTPERRVVLFLSVVRTDFSSKWPRLLNRFLLRLARWVPEFRQNLQRANR